MMIMCIYVLRLWKYILEADSSIEFWEIKIDGITVLGYIKNIFKACKRIICADGMPSENIYCAAIGGTV